jgi:hypothetical protein
MATGRHVGGGLRLAPRSAAIGEDALAWRGAAGESRFWRATARWGAGRRWQALAGAGDVFQMLTGRL